MKKLILCILLVMPCMAIAQGFKILGKVVDFNEDPIPSAYIWIQQSDSSFVEGTYATEHGHYAFENIENGEYIINVSTISYKKISENITVDKSIVKDFYLDETVIEIEEVVIEGNKPLIRRTADKLIFDADVLSHAGTNAFELMKFVPGVIVGEDGSMSMMSNNGVTILVNGKDSKIGGNELKVMLQSLSSESLSSVEVMTTPPSRFAAEGNAGIINIVLKKTPQNYLGGNISYQNALNKYDSHVLNGSFIINKSKVTASIYGGVTLGKSYYEEFNTKTTDVFSSDNISDAFSESENYSIRSVIDYNVSSRIAIGSTLSYYKSNGNKDLESTSNYFDSYSSKIDSLISTFNPSNSNSSAYRANLYLTAKLDSVGTNIHFDIDFSKSESNSYSIFEAITYNNNGELIDSDYSFNNDYLYERNGLSSNLDFTTPIKNSTLSFGGMASISSTDDILSYYNYPDMADQNLNFDYTELLYAGYIDYSTSISEKVSFRGGVRVEYTSIEGQNSYSDSYVHAFPTMYIGYKHNQKSSFNFNVSGRINRPQFRMFTPYEIYTSKYSTTVGNTTIKPSMIYYAKLGYSYSMFNVELLYNYNTDIFSQISTFDGLYQITKWENAYNKHTTGIQTSYFIMSPQWLELFLIQGLMCEKTSPNFTDEYSSETNLSYIAMVNANIYLNKQRNLVGSINFNYTNPTTNSIMKVSSQYCLTAGLRYASVLKSDFDLTISVNNILASKTKGEVLSNSYSMYFENTYSFTTLRATLSYNFGAKLRGNRYVESELYNRIL